MAIIYPIFASIALVSLFYLYYRFQSVLLLLLIVSMWTCLSSFLLLIWGVDDIVRNGMECVFGSSSSIVVTVVSCVIPFVIILSVNLKNGHCDSLDSVWFTPNQQHPGCVSHIICNFNDSPPKSKNRFHHIHSALLLRHLLGFLLWAFLPPKRDGDCCPAESDWIGNERFLFPHCFK